MVDLGYILRRAWELFRGQRVLWLFGFIASLGTTGVRLGAGGRGAWERVTRDVASEILRSMSDMIDGPYQGVILAALALAALAISIGLALLNAIGRTALVDQVRVAEERGQAGFRSGWQAGKRHLWPVFLLRLLFGLPIALGTFVGMFPLLAWSWIAQGEAPPMGADLVGLLIVPLAFVVCLVPSVCLAVLLSVPLNILLRLAIRANVLQGCDWRGSVSRSWAMGRRHTGTLAILWLIQLGVTLGTLIVLGLPFVVLTLALLAGVALVGLASAVLSVVLTLVAGVGIWLLAAVVGGLTESYFSAVWTLAYRELLGLGLTGAEPALV